MTEAEHQRLEVLVGEWKTDGSTREGPSAPAERIDATDTYEWLPGGRALLHTVDARVGDQVVEGAEIIGYDPAREAFVTRYFGTDGPAAYEARLTEEGGTLTWTMASENDRFSGTFDDEREVITGHWESRAGDGSWRPWMDITLTKRD